MVIVSLKDFILPHASVKYVFVNRRPGAGRFSGPGPGLLFFYNLNVEEVVTSAAGNSIPPNKNLKHHQGGNVSAPSAHDVFNFVIRWAPRNNGIPYITGL